MVEGGKKQRQREEFEERKRIRRERMTMLGEDEASIYNREVECTRLKRWTNYKRLMEAGSKTVLDNRLREAELEVELRELRKIREVKDNTEAAGERPSNLEKKTASEKSSLESNLFPSSD